MDPQALAGACSSVGFPRDHSVLQASPCSSVGSLPRAAGGDLLHCGPPWAAGGQPASPWSSARAARGDSAPMSQAPPPPRSSLTLGSAELFLSHRLTLLASLLSHPEVFFLPLLKYVIPEVLPPSLIGLALASGGSVLEPAGTGCIRHGGSFSQLLTEATPMAPPLPKPCHANPQHRWKLRSAVSWCGEHNGHPAPGLRSSLSSCVAARGAAQGRSRIPAGAPVYGLPAHADSQPRSRIAPLPRAG